MTRRAHAPRALLFATAGAIALMASPALAGDLVGDVTDSTGAKTLPGAQVVITELGRRAEVDADGAFRFSNLPAGTYTVQVTYTGADMATRTVTIAETGIATLDIRMGPPAEGLVDSVLVVGQRGNLNSAVQRQKSADGIESVLTRDAVGAFPDQNVAESLRRLPGVNILNDQGEGRFVSVRGLDPNLNSASINGARVPAPEADVRSVALDVIPSELIESIEVKKTLTPDQDADTIGASIDIKTTSGFDRRKDFYSVTVEGSYNDLNGEWSPKASVDISKTFGDRLGISGGLSYYKRSFSTDNVEMEDWEETGGIVAAKTVQYRDYDVERTRIGGSLSLDFRLTDNTDIYARFLHSKFEDQEYRNRLIFEMEGDPISASGDTVTFRSNEGRITAIRDLKDRYEVQTITSLVSGGRTYAGPWEFNYSVSWSMADEKEDGSIDPIRWRQRFTGSSLAVDFDYSNREKPKYAVTTGLTNFLNPARYSLYRVEETDKSDSEERESNWKFDIKREFQLGSGQFDLQAGAKLRLREKTYDLDINYYTGYTGGLTLAPFLGDQSYNLADIEPTPSRGAPAKFFHENRSNFVKSALDTLFESSVADYNVKEDIYAAYLLGRYEAGPVRVVGGVRVERTELTAAGSLVELVEGGGTHNGVVLADDTVFVSPLTNRIDYTDVLPSLTVRFEATDNLLIRGGFFKSVVRPRVGQIAPRFIVEESDAGERDGEFGNPELDPYRAWNFDLSAEWYFAKEGVLSAGIFYKEIKDFIVDAEFNNGVFNSVAYDKAIIPINGDTATVFGVEFNYQHALTFLPGLLDGTIVGFNYTYTDAEGDVLGRTIPLPSASKNTYNATIGYEKGPVSFRFAATYRDKYLDELGSDAETDRWVKDHIQYDVSAKYRITDHAQAFIEFVNLGDAPYVAYQNGPDGKRLLQYEEYSWTAKTGIKLKF
ncbi:TonB-dependent receptor [Caulobacter sp. NIBR1757]|uniref:TonB-dependent receptor n=1 Tax=Caulobacter sp. NIBR1757 TaxID=3016000 RepID=UPI0022F116A6|nr:TonB-dependent receptor [Caulobacter sp. NIBR1757]WGM38504.1 Vitamin B12 transporter BtuB [Caulobacter sp. NIBR1757]